MEDKPGHSEFQVTRNRQTTERLPDESSSPIDLRAIPIDEIRVIAEQDPDTFDTSFGHLLAHDVDRAKEVCEALAASPNPEVRRSIAWHISELSLLDHDYCLRVWRRLLQDEDASIRRAALTEIFSEPLEAYNSELERVRLSEYGLTIEDAYGLLYAFAVAEQGYAP